LTSELEYRAMASVPKHLDRSYWNTALKLSGNVKTCGLAE